MSFDESHYNDRLQALIDGLVARTRDALSEDTPLWEQPEADIYELSLKKTSMRIFSKDGDGQRPYVFELYDGNGNLVESVIEDPWGAPVKIEELYNLVSQGERQKAKDEALRAALQELEIPDPPPF